LFSAHEGYEFERERQPRRELFKSPAITRSTKRWIASPASFKQSESTLFALVDHSGEAQKVGLKMPPTKWLIFGNPKAGTPLMLASPSSALDLPLKILIWPDATGKAWLSYNTPEYLRERHNFPPELLPNIAVVEILAAKAAE